MEAANRGASEAAGVSIGLGISLPMESSANPYITRELGFEFHYFFMRKFWFVYLAKAMAIFPGGFGTLDELFEVLTLVQTKKVGKRVPVVLYGREFGATSCAWTAGALGHHLPGRQKLFHVSDSPDDAFGYLTSRLTELYVENGQG
jgi:predicted Rossmann-fold nucleotide-binding protein